MFILYPEKVLTTKSAPQESGADNGIFYSKYIYINLLKVLSR